jgi:hypothetical protein
MQRCSSFGFGVGVQAAARSPLIDRREPGDGPCPPQRVRPGFVRCPSSVRVVLAQRWRRADRLSDWCGGRDAAVPPAPAQIRHYGCPEFLLPGIPVYRQPRWPDHQIDELPVCRITGASGFGPDFIAKREFPFHRHRKTCLKGNAVALSLPVFRHFGIPDNRTIKIRAALQRCTCHQSGHR